MFKKLIYLVSCALVLSLISANVVIGGFVLDIRISSGADDAEEHLDNGDIDVSSSDIEMPYDDAGNPPSDPQLVGLCFQNVEIPAGAVIDKAYIQFLADDEYLAGGPVNLIIFGQKEPNPNNFATTTAYMISSAPKTSAAAKWSNLPDWISGKATPESMTPDISVVIQELIDQDGWMAGNPMMLIVGDDPDNPSKGIRSAQTYNGMISGAPLLHVEFSCTYARNPIPPNGSLYEDTWASLSWQPGETAVSHDVYFGDNFEDVKNGTGDTFIGNQVSTLVMVGFPGLPFPEGLVPGTTYYWRVDEVEADGVTKHKGPVWSFMIPPKTAFNPNPPYGAEFVDPNKDLSWTAGYGGKLHHVYLGDNYADVNDGIGGTYKGPTGVTSYEHGPLELEKVYYWRVDEFDGLATYKGDVWAFTTPGAAGNSRPSNGATSIKMTTKLKWTPADHAASHHVYFGTDENALWSATTSSPEYKGNKPLGSESYDPGKLAWYSTYYWRVDAVYNAGNLVKGLVWSFTTADSVIVDDFESYTDNDTAGEAIWQSWIDGYGIADNGAQVGNMLPPYAEQAVVHGGTQSMPLVYNNIAGVRNSEAVLPLTDTRDWTQEGVVEFSLWFLGNSANAAEPLYVALSNSTGAPVVITHDNPSAAQIRTWTEWVIPLQNFADRGINLTNVDKIAIGLGFKGNVTAPGGNGKIYIDDIRLCRPAP